MKRVLVSLLWLAACAPPEDQAPVPPASKRQALVTPFAAGSLIVARRICERVSKATLQRGDQVLNPTISAGVAAGAPGHEYGFSDLVRQATDGLNAAMARGGNRVEFFDSVEKAPQGLPMVAPSVPPSIR